MTLLDFDGSAPTVDPSAWVAPNATLIGRVTLGADASVFFGAVLRADISTIDVGAGTNLQDGVIVHADPDFPTTIGGNVTVGHAATLHGCTVEDGALIAIGAIVLNGAVIGASSLVGAGALVTPGTVIPPRSLVLGSPAKVRRELTDDEIAANAANSARYVVLARRYREQT
jgi:carbonic anhydrase/acetyltransferase-like protein (isoleucine patch superfamily)